MPNLIISLNVGDILATTVKINAHDDIWDNNPSKFHQWGWVDS